MFNVIINPAGAPITSPLIFYRRKKITLKETHSSYTRPIMIDSDMAT